MNCSAVALILVIGALSAPALAVQTISNPVYEAHVQSLPGTQRGSWNAVTGAAHPVGPGKNLLFRDMQTNTNFSSLRVYDPAGNRTYTFGGTAGGMNLDTFIMSEAASPLVPAGQGWRTIWVIPNEHLQITQDVVIVGSTFNNSAIYHTVEVKNTGNASVKIGWRNLYDWTVNDPNFDDGPSNRLESDCGQTVIIPTTGNEFAYTPVVAQLCRVATFPTNTNPTYEPLLALNFDPALLANFPVTPPQEYDYVNWVLSRQTSFDYTPTGQLVAGPGAPDDSAGLSWWGKTDATGVVIAAGQASRFTQAIFGVAPGGCIPPPGPPVGCAQISNEVVNCNPEAGEFSTTFTLQNTSGVMVRYIMAIPPQGPPNITINPRVTTLPQLLPTGGSVSLTYTISGANPGADVCFTIVMADDHFVTCCSIQHCVTPNCCEQVTDESLVCVPPPNNANNAFDYTFHITNFTGQIVEHVFLIDPLPAVATFNPNHYFYIHMLPGETRTFTTRITGTAPGTELCILISLLNIQQELCCAREHCITVPNCATGACCLGAGQCQLRTQAQCANSGGNYLGDNTACTATSCPAVGACCVPPPHCLPPHDDPTCQPLSQAACQAVGGFYQGDGTTCAAVSCGTCNDVIHARWEAPCCLPMFSHGDVTICNPANVAHTYQWNMTTVPSLPPPSPCVINGPTVINPNNGTLTVAAHSCVTFPFELLCAPNQFLGAHGCYNLHVKNLDTGCCYDTLGSTYQAAGWKVEAVNLMNPIPFCRVGVVQFMVDNIGDPDNTFEYFFQAMPSDMVSPETAIRLDGQPVIGQPTPLQTLTLGINDPPVIISVHVEFVVNQPFVFHDVLVEFDTDNNPNTPFDAGTSAGVVQVPNTGPQCVGDVNSDGTVGVDDLLQVIINWGGNSCAADVNHDGFVGTDDLLAVINHWGPCP